MWMQHSLKVTSAFMFSSCCTIKYRAILDRKKVYVDIFLSNFIPVAVKNFHFVTDVFQGSPN